MNPEIPRRQFTAATIVVCIAFAFALTILPFITVRYGISEWWYPVIDLAIIVPSVIWLLRAQTTRFLTDMKAKLVFPCNQPGGCKHDIDCDRLCPAKKLYDLCHGRYSTHNLKGYVGK